MADQPGREGVRSLLSKLENQASLTDEELGQLQSQVDELERRAESHHETSVSQHHTGAAFMDPDQE